MLYGGSQAKRNLQPSEEEHGKGKGSSSMHDFSQFTAEAIGAKKHFWLKDWEGKKKNYHHLHYEFQEQIYAFRCLNVLSSGIKNTLKLEGGGDLLIFHRDK